MHFTYVMVECYWTLLATVYFTADHAMICRHGDLTLVWWHNRLYITAELLSKVSLPSNYPSNLLVGRHSLLRLLIGRMIQEWTFKPVDFGDGSNVPFTPMHWATRRAPSLWSTDATGFRRKGSMETAFIKWSLDHSNLWFSPKLSAWAGRGLILLLFSWVAFQAWCNLYSGTLAWLRCTLSFHC